MNSRFFFHLNLIISISFFCNTIDAQKDMIQVVSKNNFEIGLKVGIDDDQDIHNEFNFAYNRDITTFSSLGIGTNIDYNTGYQNDMILAAFVRTSLFLPKRRTTPYLVFDIGKTLFNSTDYNTISFFNFYNAELGYRIAISPQKELAFGIGIKSYLIEDLGYGYTEDGEIFYIVPQLACTIRL